jgi:hypothetical protein
VFDDRKGAALQREENGLTGQARLLDESSAVIADVYTDNERKIYGDTLTGMLSQITQLMRYAEASTIRLESHCDDRGTQAYSMVLGEQRAKQMSSFLQSLGIEEARISRVSYGQEQPRCIEFSVDCWEDNLRMRKTFKVLSLKEPKNGCLVRVYMTNDPETIRYVKTSPASSFLQKVHLAEPPRRLVRVGPRPLAQ